MPAKRRNPPRTSRKKSLVSRSDGFHGGGGSADSHKVGSEGFFSKRQIITAGWAALFALVGYVFGFIDPFDKKPQEVIVKNIDSLHGNSTAGATVVALDADTRNQLDKLRGAILHTESAIASVMNRNSLQKDMINPSNVSAREADLEELERTRRALKAALASSAESSAKDDSAAVPRDTSSSISLLVPQPARTDFNMPVENRGYTLNPTSNLKGVRCPSYSAASRRLHFYFELDAKTLKSVAIFRATVARVDAPLKQTQLFDEKFNSELGPNEVELSFSPGPGVYDVTLGYYDVSKLSGEFPPFYGLSCVITVNA